jgi:hypothetical protein
MSSTLVPAGGHLFYHYLSYFATTNDRLALRRLIMASEDRCIDRRSAEFRSLVIAYRAKFYMFVLTTLPRYAGLWQRYYLSFLLEFKGVSRAGIDVLNSLGLGVSLSTYDRYRKDDEKFATDMVKYVHPSSVGYEFHSHPLWSRL